MKIQINYNINFQIKKGSRGVKENSELKCEVTLYLKEGYSVKEGFTNL